jgi:hypothetical protein
MLCPEYGQQAGGRPLHIFLRQNWARERVRDEFVQQQQQQRGSGREGCGLQEGATHRAAYHRVPPFYGEEHTTPQQGSLQLGIPSASPPGVSWLCLGGVAPSLARHARLPPPPPPQQQLDSSRTQQRIDPLLIWRLYIVHCSLFLLRRLVAAVRSGVRLLRGGRQRPRANAFRAQHWTKPYWAAAFAFV